MYQSNTSNYTEEDFNELVTGFEEQFIKLDSLSIEFNMNATYCPNHACIWNKIDYIGEECTIVQKNDKLALVRFKNPDLNKNILRLLYRIEDLSLVKEKKKRKEKSHA